LESNRKERGFTCQGKKEGKIAVPAGRVVVIRGVVGVHLIIGLVQKLIN